MKSFLLSCLSAASLLAQSGDKAGEVQAPPPASLNIPPAPPLSVGDALKSFQVQPGFKVEVVASEPLVEAPVEIEFDADGRLYVVEMRPFMPNVDGKGEDQRIGRVSRLEDTDGDGRMDKSVVFADNLLMPRALAVVKGGVLIAEPPHLWFFADDDGDGKSDRKEMVSNDYGNQANPEHTANGLLWGRDNWVYSANHTARYRYNGDGWGTDTTIFRGQWGISQDDYGRLFFNSNSDQFRGDLVPAHYLSRNPDFKSPYGRNVQIAKDQSVFPARINPGVNRGYQKGTLRPDGRLARFTGACGPVIYRGDLFPEKFYGAGFLCEPTANFVRCNFIKEENGILTAENAFPNEEFLASTDERFRPVNLANGPDGALYVVDMYRGVIQHRIYLTTFLRNQALDRGLETPLNMGRIYRVVPEGVGSKPVQKLSEKSSSDLPALLQTGNGWTRDTVQRLLVERHDASAVQPLRQIAAEGKFPGALHALWVLDAMQAVDAETAQHAMKSADSKVRATAVRVAERFLAADKGNAVREQIVALAKDPSFDVQLQVMFSLGESKTPEAEAAMAKLVDSHVNSALIRDAAISGLHGREIEFISRLLDQPRWDERSSSREEMIRDLARAAAESREPERVGKLLNLAADQDVAWQKNAILDGIAGLIPVAGKGKTPSPVKPLHFASEPKGLTKLAAVKDDGTKKRLEKLESLLVWAGKEGFTEEKVTPLTVKEKELFEAGKTQYLLICGACHQANGMGLEGLAPPLIDSDWVTGSTERLTRIVLQGMRGPVNVKGRVWELEMPPLNILTDEEIAALLTYVRREWGHTASAVAPEQVGKIREATADRIDAWTEAELMKVK